MNLFNEFKRLGFTITTGDKIPTPKRKKSTISIKEANRQMDLYSKITSGATFDPEASEGYQFPWYSKGLVPTLNLHNTNMMR